MLCFHADLDWDVSTRFSAPDLPRLPGLCLLEVFPLSFYKAALLFSRKYSAQGFEMSEVTHAENQGAG
jgi:hypothetical protein